MRLLVVFLLAMLALVAPLRLSADPLLDRPFRAADLTTEEIRHVQASKDHRGEKKAHIERGEVFNVTELRHGHGGLQYLWTMRRPGAAHADFVSIWADPRDFGLLNLVATSLRDGYQPDLQWNAQGVLGQIWTAWIAAQPAQVSAAPPKPEAAKPAPAAAAASGTPQLAGTGSGFHVSASGHVLTNSHVIEGCTALRVDGRQAVLKAANAEMDLALLLTAPSASGAVAGFRDQPAGLNADVTVVGFPLSGLLGGLNITRGAVSSLTGIRGDLNRMQISAPVQPGNSGGPVVAPDGGVVGIVASKLDAIKAMENTGDIPQNVNFAIRGEMAQLFLSTEGLTSTRRPAAVPLPPEALAKQVVSWTVRVECWR